MSFESGSGNNESEIFTDKSLENTELNSEYISLLAPGNQALFSRILENGVKEKVTGDFYNVSPNMDHGGKNKDLKTFTDAESNVSIDMRPTTLISGEEELEGWQLHLKGKAKNEENSFTLAWSGKRPNIGDVGLEVGQISGALNGEQYSQPFGKIDLTKMVGDITVSAGGYALGVADLGELNDGATVVFGAEDEPLVLNNQESHSKYLTGLSLGVEKNLENIDSRMRFGCDLMKEISTNFSGCHINFEQSDDDGNPSFSARIDTERNMELKKNINSYFQIPKSIPGVYVVAKMDDSLDPEVSLEFTFLEKPKSVRSFASRNN